MRETSRKTKHPFRERQESEGFEGVGVKEEQEGVKRDVIQQQQGKEKVAKKREGEGEEGENGNSAHEFLESD